MTSSSATGVPPLDAPTPSLAERVRRLLLVGLTALLVARPLVPGEDPGHLTGHAEPTTQALTLLTLLLAAAWASWHAAAGRGRVPVNPVELALLAVALSAFVSAAAAPHQRPARLIAWEWLGLLTTFGLVRRLPTSPREQRGVLAALLATAVTVSAHAVYQCAVEFPQLAARVGGSAARLQQAFERVSLEGAPQERFVQAALQRLEDAFAVATFAHPNSLASYLVLFLPGLVAAALCSRRSPAWQQAALWACAALGAAALGLTRSRGAGAAALLVALIVGIVWRQRPGWIGRRWAAAGALALGAFGLVAWQTGLLTPLFVKGSSGGLSARVEYWQTTAAIIGDHPWLGVGPGNFGNTYARYRSEGGGENVHDPHNFLLEVWATCGVGAVAALVAGLAWMLRTFCRPDDRAAESALPASTPPGSLGWEFVVGGAIGMVLTLVLRGQSMEFRGDEVLAAGLRSIVWAAAFAVLARVAWTPRAQRLALAAGVAAALLNLSLSGGIAFPAVAAPWWAAAALVLNAIEPPAARADVPGRWRWAGLLLVPVALAYLVTIWLPVVSAFNPALGAARVLAQFRGGVLAGRPRLFLPPDFQRQQLEQHVLAPLRAACAADPGNARLQVLLAEGLTELAKLAQAAQDRHEAESLGQAALAAARRAQELNPHGASMYLAGGEVYLALAAWPEDRAAEHVLGAADELKQAVNNDPTDPTMRGQRAELLFAAAEALDERARKEMAPERVAELRDRHRETTAEGRREAEEALRLDQLTVWVGRKLSPQERTRLARRLDQPQSRVQGRSP